MDGRDTVRIRTATEEDAAAAVALWTEAYVTHGVGGRTAPYVRADFDEFARNGEVFVVDGEPGTAGGPLAGVVVLSPPGAAANAVAAGPEERR